MGLVDSGPGDVPVGVCRGRLASISVGTLDCARCLDGWGIPGSCCATSGGRWVARSASPDSFLGYTGCAYTIWIVSCYPFYAFWHWAWLVVERAAATTISDL